MGERRGQQTSPSPICTRRRDSRHARAAKRGFARKQLRRSNGSKCCCAVQDDDCDVGYGSFFHVHGSNTQKTGSKQRASDVLERPRLQWLIDTAPQLKSNLVSVSSLIRGDYTVTFSSECQITNKHVMVAKGPCIGGVYIVHAVASGGRAHMASAPRDTLQTYHERLGHANVRDIVPSSATRFCLPWCLPAPKEVRGV